MGHNTTQGFKGTYDTPNLDTTVQIDICERCGDPIYLGDGVRATERDEEGNEIRELVWHWYPHNGKECWVLTDQEM